MTISLYALAGAGEQLRFSPYCWRIKPALEHKGLKVSMGAWRFTHKEAIAFSGQSLVPVWTDGDKTVCDSWDNEANLLSDRIILLASRPGQLKCVVHLFATYAQRGSAGVHRVEPRVAHDRRGDGSALVD